jgi:hypothetical protein
VGTTVGSASTSYTQGPPGTGKTRTLLGFMQVLCATNRQRGAGGGMSRGTTGPILAAADTNAACDNLVAGLLERGVCVVRMGQPAKVRRELWGACLDAQVEMTASGKRVSEGRDHLAAVGLQGGAGRGGGGGG